MTIISNPVTGPVLGQSVQPGFGVQFSGTPPANTIVAPVPLADTIGPTKLTLLESISRGATPRNAMVTAVGSVSTGSQNPTPLDDLMSNGAGNQVNQGVAVAGSSGNPTNEYTLSIGAPQRVVDGFSASSSTGPSATNTETLTSCPVSGATLLANITLNGAYQG
jgi:hypothetical protein